ncbi:hypothetical protein DPMN_070819 [Dreissena polymorpha]|uniref:Uncharacterized protein n=1 Tax=Dreissena polymorpha TaxID=45954 RepID=A0A9D3Z6V1_DREPO|nr:hypothetical protein DPMN_070819 [Dreissena polymorpha]
MIQVRKVIEHVYEKVLGQGSDAGSQAPSSGGGPSGDKADEGEDISAIAEEKVELLCNDQVREHCGGFVVYCGLTLCMLGNLSSAKILYAEFLKSSFSSLSFNDHYQNTKQFES